MNWEHIDLLYDLERTFKETRDVRFLCNQFIHSFVFVPFEENERIGGFLVSSDKEKNKKLYRVTLDQVVSLFRVVGRNYPSDGFFRYDHDTGQFLYGVR